MRKRSKLGLLLAAIACAGVVAPQAQAGFVDDFTVGSQFVQAPDLGNPSDDDAIDIGGGIFRQLYVQLDATGNDSDISLRAGGAAESASISTEETNAPNLLDGSIAHITWDSVGASLNGSPNFGTTIADLDGYAAFHIQTSSPGDNRMVNIQLWDTGGNLASGDFTLASSNDPNHYLSFASLTNIASLDLANIGAIRLNFLTDDITITSISAVVPVPPAVGLGLLGMFLVGGIRRRKSHA